MGRDLFATYPDWTALADEILGYSIQELCIEDPRAELGRTEFTQPALFVVSALSWRARLDAGKPMPDFLAGHSLGEYNALLAAEVFDFPTGLRLVKERGAIMGRVSGGGMAAVVGIAPDRIAEILAATDAGRRLDVANFNAFDQTVIAGPVEDIAAVKPDFEAAGVRAFTPLKVSAPFHSRYMEAPMNAFRSVLSAARLNAPTLPVIANVTASPYGANEVLETLGRQIGSSVRWLDTMVTLLDRGVTEFEEVGPGNVLTKLAQRIRKARG
jgi:trans-AT polyketide synthase/acyltransferase/oxidoreductase domain-containing protein